MASLEELEARMDSLERQMAQLRQDSTAAHVLANAAARDVAEFRETLNGHTSLLNAIRETQLEQGQRLDRLERKVDEGFTKVNLGMNQITVLLQSVIDQRPAD
ncbi:hypothetical protein ACFWY9_39165 [Amycolatopsis sp. NPDC059027]|uniref:hypothetical protein n=1 Tax=unclassified Amycolatopsis TaxID=2618356 RepID=UPI00366E4CA9